MYNLLEEKSVYSVVPSSKNLLPFTIYYVTWGIKVQESKENERNATKTGKDKTRQGKKTFNPFGEHSSKRLLGQPPPAAEKQNGATRTYTHHIHGAFPALFLDENSS